MRFYHAKIDAGSLASGEEYSGLRNVVVIFITTYDPFGLGRMVYTIKNGCVEVPEMPYDDGAQTIFLYTGGDSGGITTAVTLYGKICVRECGDTGIERAAPDGDGDPAGRRGRACVYEEF